MKWADFFIFSTYCEGRISAVLSESYTYLQY